MKEWHAVKVGENQGYHPENVDENRRKLLGFQGFQAINDTA